MKLIRVEYGIDTVIIWGCYAIMSEKEYSKMRRKYNAKQRALRVNDALMMLEMEIHSALIPM